MRPHSEASDQDLEAVRGMTPEEKLRVMHALIGQAYELKAAGIRARWPEMSDEDVEARARAMVAGDVP